MNRQQKEHVVSFMHNEFAGSSAAFLVGYSGLSVHDMQLLRKQVRKLGGLLKVAKMRLIKKAIGGISRANAIDPFCKNQVSVVFAQKDPFAIAKALHVFSKEHEALTLVAGYFEDTLLDKSAIIRMASLPSREILLAQLCGTLMAPLTGLAVALKQLSDQKAGGQATVDTETNTNTENV